MLKPDASHESFESLSMLLLAHIMIIVIGILTLLLLVSMIGSLLVMTPYIPTPRPIAQRMVRLAALRGDETVFDLGAGDGAILIAAKKLHPGIRAIGWEFVCMVWMIGLVRIAWSRQHVSLRLGDALRAPLNQADCIFLYLLPGKLKQLEKLFDRELKPGTKVISHAFRFPHRKPIAQDILLLHGKRRKVWMYQW